MYFIQLSLRADLSDMQGLYILLQRHNRVSMALIDPSHNQSVALPSRVSVGARTAASDGGLRNLKRRVRRHIQLDRKVRLIRHYHSCRRAEISSWAGLEPESKFFDFYIRFGGSRTTDLSELRMARRKLHHKLELLTRAVHCRRDV